MEIKKREREAKKKAKREAKLLRRVERKRQQQDIETGAENTSAKELEPQSSNP